MKLPIFAMSLSMLILVACGGGGDGGGPPQSPSSIDAALMDQGVHVFWSDDSKDETGFVLERAGVGGSFEEVATVPFDTDNYHDAAVGPGTWRYRVAAENDAGLSDWSVEATIERP